MGNGSEGGRSRIDRSIEVTEALSGVSQASVLRGLRPDQVVDIVGAGAARIDSFDKDDVIFSVGSYTDELGIVLEGRVGIAAVDVWGGTSMLDVVEAPQTFGEVYAYLPAEPLAVDVHALSHTRILFINLRLVFERLDAATGIPGIVRRNLLDIMARRSLYLSRRMFHMSAKGIRNRVLSYLSDCAREAQSNEFDIPFNRQQLTNYLSVDRSALSAELSRMRRDGLIDTARSHFVLHAASSFASGRSGCRMGNRYLAGERPLADR